MPEEITIFEIMKPILFWVSPVILAVGIFLLIAEYKFRRLEDILGKEIGGIKKKVFPKLETSIYTFQNSLLSKRAVVGTIFIICSFVFFFVFKD